MKETEITVEVLDNVDDLIKMLKEKGFSLDSEFDMIDHYFSKENTETLKTLDYKDIINNSFLVRELTKNNSKTLLFKSKEFDENNNVIAEEKVKCNIDSIENAVKIFNLAGLNNWLKLKQHLLVFVNDKFGFAIQIVDGLGTFIEYEETESIKHLSEQEKINSMLGDLKNLGINFGSDYSCKKPYMKFKKDNNL